MILGVRSPPVSELDAQRPAQFGRGDIPAGGGLIRGHFALVTALGVIPNQRDVLLLNHPEVTDPPQRSSGGMLVKIENANVLTCFGTVGVDPLERVPQIAAQRLTNQCRFRHRICAATPSRSS